MTVYLECPQCEFETEVEVTLQPDSETGELFTNTQVYQDCTCDLTAEEWNALEKEAEEIFREGD